MLAIGGFSVFFMGVVQAAPPVARGLYFLWGIALFISAALPAKAGFRLHRGGGILAVFASVGVMTLQADAVPGGAAAAEGAFVALFPLVWLVVVHEDSRVAGASGLASFAGTYWLAIGSVSAPPSEQAIRMLMTSAIVGIVATAGAFYHGLEHRRDLRLAQERGKRAVDERLQTQMERSVQVGRLAADVGHEINNPLTVVVGNLNWVLDNAEELAAAPEQTLLAEDDREALADALESAEQAARVVHDLKDMAKASERASDVDVRASLEKALRMAKNELRHRARVVTRLKAVPAVTAVEGRLTQVFTNLLINAAHAITEGRAHENEVTVTCTVGGFGEVLVKVEDTGAGIPESVRGQIFEPFFTTKKDRGTGLGLAICKRVVEEIGGRIEVSQRPGGGTCFVVLLPAAEPSERNPAAPGPDYEASGRILIVDDEAMVAKSLARLLSPSEVTVATSAEAAWTELKRTGFDFVLCDVMMPDTTGIELYERVREHLPAQAGRFALMTGGAFTQDASRYLEKAAVPVLDKPVDMHRLRKLLARG